MISIKGLNKFFNRGKQNEIHVINDVTLDLPEKGMVAIFGKSGCGKTTLLNVIGGLDGFASGEISIENRTVLKNTDDVRNRYIGYIFQNYNLLKNESCFDNVAAALRLCGMTDEEEIRARVTEALKNVGMEKYEKRSPDTLSGGQQQRIAIARAIVKNPRIILADEPTGNLDELNTVMIMDLLKAISKEHLVVLVTHEANLVDYYCDTVIELSDGRVESIRNNEAANGYATKNKNDIYLGELQKKELSDGNATVEYYGEAPDAPIKLRIINKDGKIFVKIENEKVRVLDESSEIRLREGVYEEKPSVTSGEKTLDMSALPPVKAEKTGRLFSLRSSLRSGYKANFGKKGRRGKKVLRRFMALFASVIVFISAIFGTAFKDIFEADGAYNHNVFYLYTPDGKTSDKLTEALSDPDSGIDYIRLMRGYPQGDANFSFRAGSFETFGKYDFSTIFGTNAVLLDASLTKDLTLLEGKKDSLGNGEMVITSRVAEALIEKSALGYIKEPRDLLGLLLMSGVTGRTAPRISGVVESDETAVYMNSITLARYTNTNVNLSLTAPASDYGITLASGEAILAIRADETGIEYPSLGQKIKLQGIEFTVTKIRRECRIYEDWLAANGFSRLGERDYFLGKVKESYPLLVEGTPEFDEAYEALRNEGLYGYYDYYYSEIDGYFRDYMFFEPYNFEMWLYLEKGVEAAKYVGFPQDYYKAVVYKAQNGRYPTVKELEAVANTLPTAYEVMMDNYGKLEDEFYQTYKDPGFGTSTYLVSDGDYIALASRQ